MVATVEQKMTWDEYRDTEFDDHDLFIIENEDYVNGAPDLVVEVISPGSIRRDRVDKKDLYERYAVKEFWLIDPQNKTVEIYTMENNAYRLHEFQEQEGKVTSLVLEGFEIDIATIFEA